MDPNQLLPEMQGNTSEKKKRKESSSEDSSSDSSDKDSSSSGKRRLATLLQIADPPCSNPRDQIQLVSHYSGLY